MARRVGRSQWAQEAIGFLLATYLRFVQRTSRFTTVPEDLDLFIKGELPLIAAMWHGQHLMTPLARPRTMDRLAVLISRHEDAGAQALAAERLDITPVRGSGGPADRVYYKGGASAMRELMRQLEIRRLSRHDRRRAEARARRGARESSRWPSYRAVPSSRPRWYRACASSSTPGIAPRSDCRSAARWSSPAISSAFQPTRTAAEMEAARAAPSSMGSTKRTGRPTPWLEQAIPALS